MPDLDSVFSRLRELMAAHASGMEVVTDKPGNYYLNTGKPDAKGKAVFFGMVKTGKGKVAYHLMPAYEFPELLDGMSEDLRRRMQGKSCFNFTKPDEALFAELEELTASGLRAFAEAGKA